MKINKEDLRQLIKEEIQKHISYLNETQVKLTQKLIKAWKEEIENLKKLLEKTRNQTDREEIEQAILNLESNLVQYDPSYRIETASSGSDLRKNAINRTLAGSF